MAQDRFSNEKYVDWVKVKLSLQYAKEGLEPTTEQNVQTFYNRLSSRLQAPSSSSASGGPITCNSCVKADIKRKWSRQRFTCLSGICDRWLDLLKQDHVSPTSTVEWDNFDVSQLPASAWECAKVYLPYGSSKIQSAGDCDLAAILSLYLNCRPFASSLRDVTLCEKVKEVRNGLLHSGTMEVERSQLLSNIGFIKQLLSDQAFAADSACQEAVTKIDKLVRDKLELSLNKELELSVLNDDIKSVVVKTEQLRIEVCGVTTDVSKLDGELKTEVRGVTTEVSTLKDRQKTHISAVNKEMINLKDKMEASMKEIVELQKVADLLYSFLNACHIENVDIGQLAASISTLSTLRAETDRQAQVVSQLQETVGRHEVTLEQHGVMLEQQKRKLNTIESDLRAKRRRSNRQNPEMIDVAALQQHLLAVYKDECKWENPVTADEDKPVTISQMYVKPTIKLVRQRDQNEHLATVQQSQRESESIPLSYRQCFYTSTELCQNIYITGNAGMGKTTFCKELVQCWCKAIQIGVEEGDSAEDMGVLKEFSLLFYVNLRDVGSHYHIEDMIRENLFHNAPIEYNISDILKKEKCLVVLDGLDEWSCQKNVNICRGLNKDIPGRNTMNKNCTYITTTRNWKFDTIDLKSKDCDKHAELCGFNESSSKEMAKKIFCMLNPQSQNKRRIRDFFKEAQKKNLTSLTNVPILLIHLVTLWYFCKDLGKSQVQLYCKMLELLLEQAKKHLPEKSSTVTKPVQTDSDLPGCFSEEEDNCHNHKQLLLCLSKLAFASLLDKKKEDSLVFKSSKLEICGIDSSDISLCLKCGILTQNKVLGNPIGRYKKYSFLHKKLQEFLAAMYLVTSHNLEDNLRQIREYCNKLDTTLEMGQMFMYVCGMKAEVGNQLLEYLTSVVSDDKGVQNSRQSKEGGILIKDIQTCVMACVAEGASNGLTVDVCLKDLQDFYVHKDNISYYIDHVVEKKVTSIKSVYIVTYGCSKEHVTAVLEHLQKVTTLEKFYLYDDYRVTAVLEHLQTTLGKFYLSDSYRVVSDSSTVASVLTSNVSTFKSLCLINDDFLHHEALFAAVLGCIPSLRALTLGERYQYQKEDKKRGIHGRIEQLLAATTLLTHLGLYLYCHEHGRQCRPVMDLSHHTQLQTLALWCMCVTNLHAVAHSVEKVILNKVTVTHSTLRQFIETLAQSSNKVEVVLDDVTVTEDSGDPADTAAYLRDCDKFIVEECDIGPDKTWSMVKFYKK